MKVLYKMEMYGDVWGDIWGDIRDISSLDGYTILYWYIQQHCIGSNKVSTPTVA